MMGWSDIVGKGGARGKGAQGKIKGDGAIRGLPPCLHINFYGAAIFVAALRILGMLSVYGSLRPRHVTEDHDTSRISSNG